MADLLSEIMDDVRADRAGDLWKKHGRWVIYTAVSIVLITAVLVYWNHHKRTVAMRETAIYLQATDLLTKGEAETALQTLDKISVREKSEFYGLVLVQKFQALTLLGKKDDAQKVLSELGSRNDTYGDVGRILMKDTTAGNKNSPLHLSREEWAAWELLAKGDDSKALAQFAALASDAGAPATLHDRVRMMENYLKYKTGH